MNGKIELIGTVAYIEQEPYIFPGTAQQNVLFGSDYDHSRYKWALKISQLE
jgi:ATP-binding cassette subfamily C (CFTR/MRP) protein 4